MNLKKILYLLLILFSFSCSKDDGPAEASEPKNFSDLVITTVQPTMESNNLSFNTGGNLSFIKDIYITGACFNKTGNPTTNDNLNYSNTSSSQNYIINFNNIEFGVTYYVRAFVQNGTTGEVKYGNELSVFIPSSVTTSIVKNISITGFSVDVNVASNLSSNTERGVCYSTSQNPTVSNSTISDSTNGVGDFTISVDGGNSFPTFYVSPNTTYYLKSYVRINSTYYYGNQVSFKTPGFIGGSGGYVFFDKGETTNGWRYLEASTVKLNDPSSNNFKWAVSDGFMSNISQEIGTGLENSVQIKSTNNFTNVAAAMSVYLANNNVNDWFLPSIKELKELYKLKSIGLIGSPASGTNSFYNKNVLSSSQLNSTTCYGINFDDGSQVLLAKTSQLYSGWQVRRF
ncbi:hypothetical protein [Flavobacterium facile]|uniref:hypothetical protein n=1 Tax=Flavobacterium facile TaxID=2893174 RepID=UPI002E7710ED|nr:hypothetical protein [Flavobacterium sp. T-12]